MSDDDDGGPKQSVDIGSGDFAPNPIYGDQPQSIGTTFDENENVNMGNDQQEPYDQNNNDYDDNNNNDNPSDNYNPYDDNNAPNQQQYDNDQQQHGNDQQQYGNDQQQYGDDQQQYGNPDNDNDNNAPPPPPYSVNPPDPPQAYQQSTDEQQPITGNNNDDDIDYDKEPVDVVAQMNGGDGDDNDIDYGVTQPKTDDPSSDAKPGSGFMGNFFIRTLFMGASIFIASMMGFAIWFEDVSGSDFAAGFGLSAFAAVILFLGSMMAIVLSILIKRGIEVPGINILVLVTMGFYLVGGLFYVLGGCAVAYGWNTVTEETSIAGIFFTEQTFVGVHGMVAGVDLWKQILNNKKWRELIYIGAFLFLSVVDFFSYAVLSQVGSETLAGPAFLAAMYFFAIIPIVLYLILWIPILKEKLAKAIILIILAGTFFVVVIMILIGYFIFIGDFGGIGSGSAYFVGVGIFVFMTGSAVALDMYLDRWIPGFKPSDDNDNSASVPTTNPDSPIDDSD